MNLTLGILGGGQLARMTAQAAARLGVRVAIFDPDPDCPAAQVTSAFYEGRVDDTEALAAFAEHCDVITLENEWVSPQALELLESSGKRVFPSSATIARIQDKLTQKNTFLAAGLELPAFAPVETTTDLRSFALAHGYPVVLKARIGGYDGYGNRTVRTSDEVTDALPLPQSGQSSLLVEEWVPFDAELAVMVVGGRDGSTLAYPVVETVQENHICKLVRAPANQAENIKTAAARMACRAVEAVSGVGVFGVEFFLVQGRLLLNEIAPRPHNSGHYTIEACVSSQFENHVRAVLGWPIGDTQLVRPAAVMINLLGKRDAEVSLASLPGALGVPRAHIHLYGKAESRVGRKMGHVTVLGDSLSDCERLAKEADQSLQL